ncbi:hypothetical protein [Verrucomicrobium spinosum]|uniref:hypothetical protein n=1 Tax=Verrucomicrobium spinosum TaxID=2736 RepID=UPI000AC8C224|nr:hypothetical protein [Verrucomicrobium spinosum]
MPSPDDTRFAPGFRFSWTDALVLILGAGLTGWLASFAGELALLAAWVIGHFFLFCNVFRIGRKPELVWAGASSCWRPSRSGWRGSIYGWLWRCRWG